MPARILLVRHGETAANEPPERVRGQSSIPLTREGVADARAAARRIRAYAPTTLFTDDLPRTAQSAREMAKFLSPASIVPLRGLRAWDMGTLTGQKKADVRTRIAGFVDHPDRPVPGGESYRAFYTRVHTAMAHIKAAATKHKATVAVVTHDSVVRALTGKDLEPGEVRLLTD